MRKDVLVLNASYMPLGTVKWENAITLWFTKKAEILHTIEGEYIHSGYNSEGEIMTMEIPSVIRLFHFVRPKKRFSIYKPLHRKNVYDRDAGICQYCGNQVSFNKFTYDHIIPRCKNGKTIWENIVVCCQSCNSKKGSKLLNECGMSLIRKPYKPLIAENFDVANINKMKNVKSKDKNWETYLSYIKK